MSRDDGRMSPVGALVLMLLVAVFGLALLEHWTKVVRADLAAGEAPSPAARTVLGAYLPVRAHVLGHWYIYAPLVLFGTGFTFRGFRRLAASMATWKERITGMYLDTPSYALPHPFQADAEGTIAATQRALAQAVLDNPEPDRQVVLGLDEHAAPIYLSDRARSMHVHLLGQTGSGKTQSVIYPLLFQDAARARSLVFLDAKGSLENERMLARIAAATGRRTELRIFSLNPDRATHTYNPLFLRPADDPRAVAERVFSTLAEGMDVPYYQDMARELFLNLVQALASTGKQMCMWDISACVADESVLLRALELATDRRAVRAIENRLAKLGDRYDQTYSGLLAALNRYDHPAVNDYSPDIVLDELLDAGGIVGFSLSANAYKFLARAVGLIVLQHIQQIGAARQMGRTRSTAPLYLYADEFYSFAYEGFVDAVNKLRDANISLLLSHQSLADLDQVSGEYSRAIWDNTRNKIVLYQNDGDLCDRLSASLGTRKNVERTVRRSVDGWMNQVSMLEASSRAVDEFILHPSRLKNLHPGQAFLVQAGVGDAPATPGVRRWWRGPRPMPASSAARSVGVNLGMLPALPEVPFPSPSPIDTESGLGLFRLFEAGAGKQVGAAAPPEAM